MATTLDQSLGLYNGSAQNPSFVTTAAAAANTLIVVCMSYWNSSGVCTGVTIGGTPAAQHKVSDSGSDYYEVWALFVAGGLASGSTIAMTFSTQGDQKFIAAASFTGVPSGYSVVTTGGATGGSGAAWTSGAATNTGQADALYAGGAGCEDSTNPTNSTPDTGTLELYDTYNATALQGWTMCYKVVSTVASDALTGDWSNANSTVNTGALVIYPAESSTPPQQLRPDADTDAASWGTTPLWSKLNDESDATVVSDTLA